VVVQADREIATLDARYAAVQDPTTYLDLPQALRVQQLQMIDEERSAFADLRHRALVESTKSRPGEAALAIDQRLAPGGEASGGPLAHVRDQIAQQDASIAGSQQQSAEAKAALAQAMVSRYSRKLTHESSILGSANRQFNEASAKDEAQRAAYAKLDEQRTELLNAVGSPDTQLSIAQQLLTSANAQSQAATEVYAEFNMAAEALYPMVEEPAKAGYEEFWKLVGEDRDDSQDVSDDDAVGGEQEEEDDDRRDPDAPVKAVALDEHPKRSRR
jgi:hypothetical protein